MEELLLGVEYDGEEWHLEVFRREHVFGQFEDVTTRLPRAVREARETSPDRLGG